MCAEVYFQFAILEFPSFLETYLYICEPKDKDNGTFNI